MHPQHDQQAAADADSQTCDVNERIHAVLEQISECNQDVISEHNKVFILLLPGRR